MRPTGRANLFMVSSSSNSRSQASFRGKVNVVVPVAQASGLSFPASRRKLSRDDDGQTSGGALSIHVALRNSAGCRI